jgi:hypothetical protein
MSAAGYSANGVIAKQIPQGEPSRRVTPSLSLPCVLR